MAKRGFTIIELLVVITILGFLIAAATVGLNRARQNERDSHRLSDLLTISKLIDQYASVNGGLYPKNKIAGASDQASMCVNEISFGSLSLTDFPKSTPPADPLALTPLSSGCTDMTNGYTYHNEYGHPAIPASGNLAAKQQVTYSLEVGLESSGSSLTAGTSFHSPDQLAGLGLVTTSETISNQTRYRWVLNGSYCGSNHTFNGVTSNSCYK